MMQFNRQAGFSLVELMVAITLSLVLFAGASSFLISTKETYQLNDDLSRVQENGRIGLDILVRDIRKAGGHDTTTGSGAVPDYFYTADCGGFNPCTDNDVATSPNNSDSIAVEYDPAPDDGTETDCTGAAIGANDIIANVYWVGTLNNVNSLYCRGFNKSSGGWVAAAQPLIDGVDSMQILYGIAGSSGSITQFVSADRVADWNSTKAVRVALLISNGMENGFAENQTRSYSVLDADELSFTDKSSRRIYNTTIYLNN